MSTATATPALRPATAPDARTCFSLFRHSLRGLMLRIGYLPPDAPPPDLDALWPAYEDLFGHLAATCAEWWIAEDADGRAIGYARSTLRGSTLDLTEFFVAPDMRVAGTGRALLDRAFAPGIGEHRAIIATLDPAAVSLYLRYGVHHQTTTVGAEGPARRVDLPAGYEVAEASLDDVLAIEGELLGHARPEDVAFMLSDRPAALLRRGGRAVAYAFGPNERGYAGPVAALDPADLPAALAHLENATHEAGHEELGLTLPLAAQAAVRWLVGERGFRLDPFYCMFLADGPWGRLDRYLPFNPCLFL